MAEALDLQGMMTDLFLNNGYEEEIVYTPAGGVAKPITAQVYRDGIVESSSSRSALKNTTTRYDTIIDISTNATTGIESVTTQTDKVTVAIHIGDSATKTLKVAGIILNDSGFWPLGLK